MAGRAPVSTDHADHLTDHTDHTDHVDHTYHEEETTGELFSNAFWTMCDAWLDHPAHMRRLSAASCQEGVAAIFLRECVQPRFTCMVPNTSLQRKRKSSYSTEGHLGATTEAATDAVLYCHRGRIASMPYDEFKETLMTRLLPVVRRKALSRAGMDWVATEDPVLLMESVASVAFPHPLKPTDVSLTRRVSSFVPCFFADADDTDQFFMTRHVRIVEGHEEPDAVYPAYLVAVATYVTRKGLDASEPTILGTLQTRGEQQRF